MAARRSTLPAAALLAALALPLAGCAESPSAPGPIPDLPRPLSAAEQAVITASNRFAFDLLREVNAEQPDTNVFISPLSASMALGMTMNGAAGETFSAMRSTLGFGELPLPEVNRAYRSLIELLLSLDPKVRMQLANAIFYRQGFPVLPAFVDTTKAYFGAEVAALDFSSPAALTTINGWASRQTNGRIPKVLSEIAPELVMALMNAIYFKGDWTQQFDPKQTQEAHFRTPGGGTVPVKMMARAQTGLRYLRGEGFTAGELAYGGGAFAMTILLPAPGEDVEALVARLDAERWRGIVDAMRDDTMEVYLPRFRLEYERFFNDALTRLGMGIAFQHGRADFSNLSPLGKQLAIDFVKQNTFVEVNEEGTEAAAVTTVGIGVTSAGPPIFRVDRPFVFAIRERHSGTILFMGKIVEPGGG